jgi:hypothetical protein
LIATILTGVHDIERKYRRHTPKGKGFVQLADRVLTSEREKALAVRGGMSRTEGAPPTPLVLPRSAARAAHDSEPRRSNAHQRWLRRIRSQGADIRAWVSPTSLLRRRQRARGKRSPY